MKVTFEQLKAAFNRVLISRGVDSETANACAEMFARTTESGVYSHGVNRFPRFIQQLENGDIRIIFRDIVKEDTYEHTN